MKILYLLPLSLFFASCALGQQATDTARFYFKAQLGDKPVELVVPGKGINHSIICCIDNVDIQGKDTAYISRGELTALYKNNFLAGEGLRMILVHMYAPKERLNKKLTGKLAWEKAALTPGNKPFAYRQDAQDIDTYQSSGVEISWKDSEGKKWSSATGPQSADSYFKLERAIYSPGAVYGGFGRYQYIITASLECTLYDANGKALPLQVGKLRIGVWGEPE